ncbi:hypothetical protein BGZ57DRAFT_932189 [Hyaloscypha finlandica]|nr:hypothetical protein BGZ57DRAFT_932189 [Hyaloscypha finlandica]KAH8786473.1 hypothetical protein F5882DRAFT_462017 [Hyaloscypha sp. PMI_1271]
MRLKQYEQTTFSWPTRRAQRCLSFAVIFAIILIFGIYEHQAYPRKAELQVDTLNAAYHYTSTPEDGMPRLPFKNTSKRKANEEPWFWYDE